MNRLLSSIKNNTLASEIVILLKKEILSGRFQPGERIVESELAEILHISRAPLREGIRTLVAEGLLHNEPRRGTFVVELTPKDIEEIYEVRLALEVQAALRLSRTFSPEAEQELRFLVEELRNSSKQHNDVALYDLDMRFHEALCRLSGNERLWRAWSQLGSQLRLCFALFVRKYQFEDFYTRHQLIIDALLTRDPEYITSVIQEHISNSMTRMLQDFEVMQVSSN